MSSSLPTQRDKLMNFQTSEEMITAEIQAPRAGQYLIKSILSNVIKNLNGT